MAAVVANLAMHHGLADAAQFVLTGGSAGGMATISNADYVHGLLQSITPAVKSVTLTLVFRPCLDPSTKFGVSPPPHRLAHILRS